MENIAIRQEFSVDRTEKQGRRQEFSVDRTAITWAKKRS